MKLFFAAVGSDLWDHVDKAHEGKEKHILFSFYDVTMSGFKFRRKAWEAFTGIPLEEEDNE